MRMGTGLTQGQHERYQNAFFLFCCLAVSLFLQIFKFKIFPEKYFFDAETVQSYMRMSIEFNPGSSYYNVALFIKWMNHFLPMDSQLAGGLVFWSLMIIPCGWIVSRYIKATWEHYLLVSAYAVMLPVFVWNTHKEALQFVFFLLIAAISYSIKNRSVVVDGMILSLLFLWGAIFRSYYIITAAGTAFFMILGQLPWGGMPRNHKKKIILKILCASLILLLVMAAFAPQMVTKLFSGRININLYRVDDSNANTILLDLFDNPKEQLSIYLANYVLAAGRMMLPVELLFQGVQYIPFAIFQLFWTILLDVAIKSFFKGSPWGEPEKRFLYLMCSWYFVSFLFEPDFGSFVRHQVAAFPMLFPVFSLALQFWKGDNI